VTSLTDVAALAGVSVATASRVMGNSSHPVSPGTRERVLAAAKSLDYESNMLARGLVANRSGTVGVVVHDILDEYFAQIVRGIEDVAYAAGYTTLVCNSDRDPEKELNYVRKLRSMCVDALLFTAGGLRDREHQRRLAVQTAKIEAVGRVVVHLAPHPVRKPIVYYATAPAIDELVGHLQGLGHRRFLYVAGAPNIATSHERVGAVLASADARGLERPRVLHSDFSRDGGRRAAPEVAESVRSGVTAILAANDQTAFGLLEGLRELGLRIPEDVSLAGFGDISACRDVSLTTVRLPLYDIGAQGMEYALRVLDGGRPKRPKTLPTQLIIRDSTAAPRALLPH
jgi:LacI family transcriptional regulator